MKPRYANANPASVEDRAVRVPIMVGQAMFHWPIERPYFATVVEVVDGDTIRCNIDLGLRSGLTKYKVRLIGCNAHESGTEAGKAAKANLESLLHVGMDLIITMVKDYKYGGEFCAKIWTLDGVDLIAYLIDQQWLAPWDGRGKATDHVPPWPRTIP